MEYSPILERVTFSLAVTVSTILMAVNR